MFKELFDGLTEISKQNNDCKIVFGKLVVKRFAHVWHVGKENFTGFTEVANYKDHLITVVDCDEFEKVKNEILELIKKI